MTARERAERLAADPTPQQRVALAREDADDFLLEAYGEAGMQSRTARRGAR